MRPLPEAQREVLAAVRRLPELEVPLADALGLVLAAPVRAAHDVPPFANSAMDGYAVRAADTAGAPVALRVLEDVPAGHVAGGRVEEGTAIKIMTGAPLPAGADAVVRVEDTEAGGDALVRVLLPVVVGTAVRPAGGDVGAGSTVLEAGERLGPAHLGVLASLGVARPPVRRRPRVAVLSTGDEVVAPATATLRPGQIRDSNRPLVMGLLAEAGVEVLDLGIVGDDRPLLEGALEKGAAEADVVLTSGGVSMGEYDLVKQVLADVGRVGLWRVAMQPAKPFAFGSLGSTPFFGLPGNPVSVMVAFEQFVRPALLQMMGSRRLFRPRLTGRLGEKVSTDPAKTVFVRVTTRYQDGEWWAQSSGGQSSNVLSALARAEALAVVPQGVSEVGAGGEVELEMFRWPESRSYQEVLGE
ncbi:MAG: molybdopterin molybdotransferase MoeA [Actinomycetota bacterium]|nr:molybdopterin molybdotransferase MoeA [Actinomycetota bacterium]